MISVGEALWRERESLAETRRRIDSLRLMIGGPSDLSVPQWAQLHALGLRFDPDLIVDLGRGYGNSTCLFTEVANKLDHTRVVSVGFRDDHAWEVRTQPTLRNALPTHWFDTLTIIDQDVRRIDFRLLFGSAKRVLLFWDMLGYGVSRYVVQEVIPLLASREHLVVVKDVTDARYHSVQGAYRSAGLLSMSTEVRALGEFLLRNDILHQTAEHSIRVWRERFPEQAADVERAWGPSEDPGPTHLSDWIYFEVPTTVRANKGMFTLVRQFRHGKVGVVAS